MAAPKEVPDENNVHDKTLAWLSKTRYAAASLDALQGGSANFIYRAKLLQPLEDGSTDVVVKHGEPHMALYPTNKLAIHRCRVEAECLDKLDSVVVQQGQPDIARFAVGTPKCYHYDDAMNTQVQEYLARGMNLKEYSLKHFPSPTPQSTHPHCHQLGLALGKYMANFYDRSRQDLQQMVAGDTVKPKPYEVIINNKEMQTLKHVINFDWLLQRVDQFPDILAEAKDIFIQVKEQALEELNRPEELTVIHGDFWTGNVLLPDAPIQDGSEIPVFIIDWENAQIGAESLDHGEMIGEMYALWLYKRIDAGLWMVRGYVQGLGTLAEKDAWRLAIQVGCHLLSFGTIAPGWGTPDQVRDVARVGRDIIVHAWNKGRVWFEGSDLSCLFAPV